MAQIDKYGARKERNIVANMDKDNDYFVRMVFPLPLTPKRVHALRNKPNGRDFFNRFLRTEFIKNPFGKECVKVYSATSISPLESLPKRLRGGSKDGMPMVYMVVCESLPKEDFVASTSKKVKVPQTPAAALACLANENADVMNTAAMWNMLDDSFNQVSLVFKLGDEFFSIDEVGMKDAFFAFLGPQIDYKGMQETLKLDNFIGH